MNLKYYFLIFIFAVLQAAFFPAVFPSFPFFNIGIILCLLLAFIGLNNDALWSAFIYGLILDFFSFISLGFSSLFFVLVVFLAIELKKLLGTNFIVIAASCVLFSFLYRYLFGFFEISFWLLIGAGLDTLLFLGVRLIFRNPLKEMMTKDPVELGLGI